MRPGMKKLLIGILFVLMLVGITATSVKATHELHPMYYGSNGWAGWSCPAGTHVVGGGFEPTTATVLVSRAAVPGSALYPIYPHYTYDIDGSIRGVIGETGWVVQAGESNAPTNIWVECEPGVFSTPTPNPDVCPNLEGVQYTMPTDYHLDAGGVNCVQFGVAGPEPLPPSTSTPQVLGATTTGTGSVLGASTMAKTGIAEENIMSLMFAFGMLLTTLGIRKVSSSNKVK